MLPRVADLQDVLISRPQRADTLAQDTALQWLVGGPRLVYKLPAQNSRTSQDLNAACKQQ